MCTLRIGLYALDRSMKYSSKCSNFRYLLKCLCTYCVLRIPWPQLSPSTIPSSHAFRLTSGSAISRQAHQQPSTADRGDSTVYARTVVWPCAWDWILLRTSRPEQQAARREAAAAAGRGVGPANTEHTCCCW